MTEMIATGSQRVFWRRHVRAAARLRVAYRPRSRRCLAVTVLAAICVVTLVHPATASGSGLAVPGSETSAARSVSGGAGSAVDQFLWTGWIDAVGVLKSAGFGDVVLAHDPETGETGPRKVTATIEGGGLKDLVEVTVGSGTVTATDGHPFWVTSDGVWVDAEDLQVGDRLLLDDGTSTAVASLAEHTRPETVYNLTVEGIHTYYINTGAAHVLVHNCSAPSATRHLCSFSGETQVLMADGTTKPISEVEAGDWVLAADPETGERGAREVTHLWVHQDTIIDLEIDGRDVATTEDHPFWNHTDSEWQAASALDAGDLVLTADGATLTVRSMKWASARTTTAYNLTVDDIHTYYVAVAGEEVLVHNTCPWELDALSASGQRVVSKDGLNRAAQKLQQHGGQGNLPVISGNVETRNALATELLDDILTAPGTRIVIKEGGNFAGGRTFIDPFGRGAVYDADGVFQYFGRFG